MSRLDTSPQSRLRHLASSLRLNDRDVDDALRQSRGDLTLAERLLRNLNSARCAAARSVPVPLTRDQRMTKCATALARTPDALDLLELSLAKVLADPNNERLRKVNLSAGVFKDRVANKNTAGVELLYSIGYSPLHGYLVLQKHDPTSLSAALDALREAKQLSTYMEAKAALTRAQARKDASAKSAADAAAARAAFLAKVPEEPKEGEDSICVITVVTPTEPVTRSTRRFSSDNTLQDLINYCKSLPTVPLDGPLVVENTTTRPARVLDPATMGSQSLYGLDLWPRGQVAVRG